MLFFKKIVRIPYISEFLKKNDIFLGPPGLRKTHLTIFFTLEVHF